MTNHLKKNGFSIAAGRLFTRKDCDAFDLIHFKEPEEMGDEKVPALACPDNWSGSAAEIFADEAICHTIPLQVKVIEENTVPSWLWRHKRDSKKNLAEDSVQQVVARVVGSATYRGWKESLFADETAARTFYDETCYALAERFFALDPKALKRSGLDWAYGIQKNSASHENTKDLQTRDIPNALIDAVVSGSRDKNLNSKWQKLLTPKANLETIALRFSDVAADWGTYKKEPLLATLDLMAFRHNNGLINIEALRHATRLLVLLLDLQSEPPDALAIGFCNLAPLLMALSIPYDSEAARTTAAALSALITAEAFAVSAELASLRGASPSFTANREVVLRSLRNHRRAAYGDKNDYEKISVIPVPLGLQDCPDLTLVAAAQRRWDEVLELVKNQGLRHIKVTALKSSPTLSLFMECATEGLNPLRSLLSLKDRGDGNFKSEIASFVCEAITRLGYGREATLDIIKHIAGSRSLAKTPVINQASLRAKGFDEEALRRIEDYLPFVDDIRLAITPFVVEVDFCTKTLKIPRHKVEKRSFDLLAHLGFKATDITLANKDYYGQDKAKGNACLKTQHLSVFASKEDVAPEARIRMAAAVQSFISGDVGLNLTLSSQASLEKSEKLILSTWRQGIQTVTLSFDITKPSEALEHKKKVSVSAFIHTQKRPSLPTRTPTLKAGRRIVSLKSPSTSKNTSKNKSK